MKQKTHVMKGKPLHPTPTGINFQKELNTSQFEAVSAIEGPHLVIAGAGSGKTRVLIHRVAFLIEKGIDPGSILLLTFTRKSAKEMISRASGLLDNRCQKISGGTFHSFCYQLLRRYSKFIGYPNRFTIADQADSEDVMAIFRERIEKEKRKYLPKKRSLMKICSLSVNTGRVVSEIVDEDYPQYYDHKEDIVAIITFYHEYKKDHFIMDYDDLLTKTVILLKEHQKIRKKLSLAYRYIMVDEYQDTNRIQAHIACLLASEHQNIMAVGDDAQSIYSFRGANFKNIMDFPKLFDHCQVTRLEQNYRSTQPILDLTNAIISNAREKYTKLLFSENKSDVLPFYLKAESKEEEAEFICQQILEIQNEGVELNQIAVLFRSSFHSNVLEVALNSYSIPYEKFGGIKFIEAAHIKDVMAYIRIVVNPLDTISWTRILLLLPRIGKVTANKLVAKIMETNLDALINKVIQTRKYADHLSHLHQLLSLIMSERANPLAHLPSIIKYYDPILKEMYDDHQGRKADLDSLIQISERYQNPDDFLADLTLDPPVSQSDIDSSPTEDKLVLSTIHSAKGLEWHSVFVIHLVQGFLPARQSLDDPVKIEEERRLFYVAATRAEKKLYLLSPNFYTGDHYGFTQTSMFLEEIEDFDSMTQTIHLEYDEETSSNSDFMDHVNDVFS
jgi:DNA helicase II / ATP-dependent DNA helicase PcrA